MVLGMASFTPRFSLLFYLQFRSVLYGCTCFWVSPLQWPTQLPNSNLSHTGTIPKIILCNCTRWVLVSICLFVAQYNLYFCLAQKMKVIQLFIPECQSREYIPPKCISQASKLLFKRGQIYLHCIQMSSGITVIPLGSSSSFSAPDFTGFARQPLEVIPQRLLPQTPTGKAHSSTTFPQLPWQVNFVVLLMKGVRLLLLAQPLQEEAAEEHTLWASQNERWRASTIELILFCSQCLAKAVSAALSNENPALCHSVGNAVQTVLHLEMAHFLRLCSGCS